MANLELCITHTANLHLNTAKVRISQTSRRIIAKQVLSTEFIADLAEGFVELRHRCSVKIFAPGVGRDLNERMFPAQVAPGTGLDGHINDAINDGVRFLCGADGLLVVHLTSRVATISNDDHHFSSLPPFERLGSKINRIV